MTMMCQKMCKKIFKSFVIITMKLSERLNDSDLKMRDCLFEACVAEHNAIVSSVHAPNVQDSVTLYLNALDQVDKAYKERNDLLTTAVNVKVYEHAKNVDDIRKQIESKTQRMLLAVNDKDIQTLNRERRSLHDELVQIQNSIPTDDTIEIKRDNDKKDNPVKPVKPQPKPKMTGGYNKQSIIKNALRRRLIKSLY